MASARVACLAALPLLAAAFPPNGTRPFAVPDDVDDFNRVKSLLVTELLTKELSAKECALEMEGSQLQNLYFHLDDSGKTVFVENPRIPPPKCVRFERLETDVFAARMDLALTFPAIFVVGVVTVRERTQAATSGPFRLRMSNLTGAGLCFTRWGDGGYDVVRCDVRFSRAAVAVAANLSSPGGGPPMAAEAFASASVDRLWTSVTAAVNGRVAGGLSAVTRRLDVSGFLREPRVFRKYKRYVIESTESANDFVDGIIGTVRRLIREKFGDSFAIPNIEERFERKVLFVTWRGSFVADGGTVRGLSTVSRVGDTAFATDDASRTHFFGNLSFERLQLHYDRYRAEFMNLGPTGTLETRLHPIRLHVHPYVDFSTGKVYLEDFEIEDVGELAVEVTGLGPVLDWVASRVATWVVGLTRDRILGRLQRRYDAYIRSLLSGYTVDGIASGAAFGGP